MYNNMYTYFVPNFCRLLFNYKSCNVRHVLSDTCTQGRFRSACAFVLSDQTPHWALLYMQECKVFSCAMDKEDWDAQADLSLPREHMSNVTFSYVVVHKTCLCI